MSDQPARRFIHTEAAGGVVLVVAALGALVWANSPWQDTYNDVRHDLHHVVNDGLMALFFFVVGLEIKREVVHGELSDRRVAALPALAAVGGMVVPALLYLAVAAGGVTGRGWGIPMATDIAFALGVLALLGSRVPPALKLFLLTLAIVDDIGAIVVIALFYGGDIEPVALLAAAGGVLATGGLYRIGVRTPAVSVVIAVVAVATWYATYQSGVHATIAGVALAFASPARSERLEDSLHPVTSFVVLPVFALANAGVTLRSDALTGSGAGSVAAGVAVGLVAGKLLGILGGAWLARRVGIATMPAELRWRHLAGAAALGGIGFTVSLFVAGLAFTDPGLVDAARLAILASSVAAAGLGTAMLAGAEPAEAT